MQGAKSPDGAGVSPISSPFSKGIGVSVSGILATDMMTINLIKPNRYQDSVTLMQVAVKLRELHGIDEASLMMGTQPNKEMLEEAGLLTSGGHTAGPNDLIIAVRGDEAAVQMVEEQLEE